MGNFIVDTARFGKLVIKATGQGKAEIELVSGDDHSVKGTPIKLMFQKDASGKVTGMVIHQAGLDVPAGGIGMNYFDWGGTGDVLILLAGLGNGG